MLRLKGVKITGIGLLRHWLVLAIWMVALWAPSVWALGTSAGISITNTAVVTFTLGSDPTIRTGTASDSFDVMEIIDVAVTWQDAADVPVNTPHLDAVTTFAVTNTGNGPESFRLSAIDTISGDDFDPAVQSIWLESNGTLGLQTSGASIDTPYGGGGVLINADDAQTVYVASNIPGGLADTQTGFVRLTAAATTAGAAGAAAGTELIGAGVGGNAIVGTTNADGESQATYVVSAPAVALAKSIVQIVDPYGGNQPYTSARITYRIRVDVSGSGTVQGLVVTDTIPADTTYVAGSILVDAVPQTDADDTPLDFSDFNVTAADAVTVNFGDIAAPAFRTIEFSVTIN